MRSFLAVLLLSLSLASIEARAAEVDQFSNRSQPIEDSTQLLENKVNEWFSLALARANQRLLQSGPRRTGRFYKPAQCREERLYESLAWYFARPVIGQLETYAEESADIPRRRIKFEDSVYQDFLWPESPSLVLSRRMAAVIKVQGVEFGSDKLGHFFTEGLSYFEATEGLEKDIQFGLHFGRWTESLYFGAQTTGVFSYADLVANFNGLRFWNRVLAEKSDPLTGQIAPYVECRGTEWVLVNEFNWQPYVDNGWNEAVNCSTFRSSVLLDKVLSHQPVCASDKLPVDKYAGHDLSLLNHEGLSIMEDSMEPEMLVWEKARLDKADTSASLISRLREARLKWEEWRHQLALDTQDNTKQSVQ